MAAAAESAKRKTVTDAIDKVLFKINELEAIIGEFGGQNDLLHTKLNEYLEALEQLHGVRDNMVGGGQSVELAVELIRAVDEGTNPDIFTLQLFKDCMAQNQISKGKVTAVRALEQQLIEQLQQAYPDVVSDYRQLRGAVQSTPQAAAGTQEAAVQGVPPDKLAAAGQACAATQPALSTLAVMGASSSVVDQQARPTAARMPP